MELWLVDKNSDLVAAWTESFADFANVFIIKGDILAHAQCSLVSPANSYGFMDGGIDRKYLEFFGSIIEENLRKAIKRRPEGYIPVGSAEIIQTSNKRIPYIIAAPTMIMPEAVPAENCFYAMMAVLNITSKHRDIFRRIYCPGLGTGIGQIPPELAAYEMAMAYRKWHKRASREEE